MGKSGGFEGLCMRLELIVICETAGCKRILVYNKHTFSILTFMDLTWELFSVKKAFKSHTLTDTKLHPAK